MNVKETSCRGQLEGEYIAIRAGSGRSRIYVVSDDCTAQVSSQKLRDLVRKDAKYVEVSFTGLSF